MASWAEYLVPLLAPWGASPLGGGTQLIATREAVPYAQRLQAGQYLVVAKGSEHLIRQANRVLLSLNAQKFRIYKDPS